MRFLVVDDSATMRRIIVNSLDRIGFKDVVEAEDGAAALALVQGGGIEFIVTDWNMPTMSGIDFARAVRGGAGAQIPILMVTTRSAREDIVAAVEAGVNNYVLKPFTPQVLKEKIDQVLQTAKAA